MDLVRDIRTSARWTLRLLAAACVLLAALCVALAVAWRETAEEASCFRTALAADETPAIAETDCL